MIGYFLVLLLVMISGNPTVFVLGKQGTFLLVFILLLAYWMRKKPPVERETMIYVAILFALGLTHIIGFGGDVVAASLGALVIVGIGCLAALSVPDFFQKYVKVMAALSALSLVFYLPGFLGVDIFPSLEFLRVDAGHDAIRHIGIHNFHLEGETRNSGMFWEPGAFAGYLIIALFFVVTSADGMRLKRWQVLCLIGALLSTQSTMGYVAGTFLAALAYAVKTRTMSLRAKLFFAPALLIAGVVVASMAFNDFDFIGQKIRSHLGNAQSKAAGYEINRFGSMVYDLQFIEARPLVGWSANPQTRISLDSDIAEIIDGHGNGLSGLFVRYGLLGGIALFTLLYISSRKREGQALPALALVVIIALLLMGEQFLNYPFVYALLVHRKGRVHLS